MRRTGPILVLLLCFAGPAAANGLLIPADKSLPPLALVSHKLTISIDDQVATTRVDQTFRNHTPRELEATYVFPVPKGASVKQFVMLVDGKEVKGEMVEADKAREIYTSIVRRTQDPGLLEHIGENLFRIRVYPIPANGEQKLAVSFTSVANREAGLIEYLCPLCSEGKTATTVDDFSLKATITSQHGIENVYSPTHAVTLARKTDRHVDIAFSRKNAPLDRDFQLFYKLGTRDVGLTALTHRPISTEDGYFLLLISPQLKMAKDERVPRDLVLVLDTSGSMAGPKMEQARKALNFCLDNVKPGDRFGLINFATTVTRYRDALTEVTSEQVTQAKKWVDELEATGGTNINEALAAALEMRTKDEGRSFTVVFFTDGCPTVGETNPEKILKNTLARNTANTRIFTFGVGDDVNATLLDRLADQTRAWASYVKPAEDIEVKVSNLHTKIAHPVLTNLKLTTTADVKIKEVYPPQLPDLFSGSQLIVLGRYSGKGPTAIRLTGKVGKTEKEFVYEQTFPDKTGDERQLVEHLWARRKVGYLLNEIRVNGQQKELVDEVTKLARRHGIATPYTSYLIVPDGTTVPPSRPSSGVPDVRFGGGQFGQFGPPMVPPPGTGPGIGGFPGGPGAAGAAGALGAGGGAFGMNGFGGMGGMSGQFGGMMGMGGGLFGQFGVSGAMRGVGGGGGGGGGGKYRSSMPPRGGPPAGGPAVVRTKPDPGVKEPPANVLDFARALRQAGIDGQKVVPVPSKTDGKEREEARRKLLLYMRAADALARDEKELLQAGELGVDLSIEVDKLRRQQLLSETGQRRIAGREFQELAGTWIDRDFKETMTAVVVKAQSDAYFRLIERRAEAKDVLRLGNRIVWVTPSGSVLVVDPGEGKTKLEDREIDALFVPKK